MCLVSLLMLILIGRGLHNRDLFLGLHLEILDVALLFAFMMPMFLVLVLPISCMLSVFLTFLRMSTDRELVALKAGGVSIYQMLFGPAIFSLVCMCFCLFVSLHGISWGASSFRATIMQIANTRAKIDIQPGVFNQNFLGLTLFARQVDPVTGKLQQIVFEDNTQGKETGLTVLAPTGVLVTDEAKGELVFKLENGRMYRVDGKNVSILEFSEYSIRLDLSALIKGIEQGSLLPKEMSWKALKTAHKDTSTPSDRFNFKVEVEIQKRIALPIACFILGVFALPLACAFEGIRRQLGVVLALVFFLVYYSIFSVGLSMGESGLLAPEVGLWLANIIFAFAAVAGLLLVSKERIPSFGRPLRKLKKLIPRLLEKKS